MLYFRKPYSPVAHIVPAVGSSHTLCGLPTRVGATYNVNDLPSGDPGRTRRVCTTCRTTPTRRTTDEPPLTQTASSHPRLGRLGAGPSQTPTPPRRKPK